MFTWRMEVVNISHNKITKDGIVHIADKLKELARNKDEKPSLMTIQMKSNELNDFSVDAIRDII